MAIGGKRVRNVVGRDRHVHPSSVQFTNAGDTTPGARGIGTAFDVEFGGGEADDVYIGPLYEINDLRAMVWCKHIERAQMAEDDSPLHAARDGLLSDVGTGEQGWVVRGIRVEVQRDIKRLCSVEKPINMAALIRIHIGAPAQYMEPHLQRFPQHALRHLIMKDPFLCERHEL